jgi:hypothetical protein
VGDVIETVRAEVTALSIVPDFTVTSRDEALAANLALGKIKALEKQLEAARKKERSPVEEQLRDIDAKYFEPRELLYEGEKVIKLALVVFRAAESKQAAIQRQIEAEAATKEKARLEEQARKQREKAEAEAAKFRGKGQEERAQAALELGEQQAGATERIAQLVAAPVTEQAPTKLPGSAFREVWYGKVTDPRVFLAALLASPYDIDEVVSFKDAGLKKLAATLKSKMDSVLPGSISWSEDIVAARAK